MPTFSGRIKEERKVLFGKYEVSDRGIVYSDGMPLAAIGGVGVNLRGKRVKICELVAKAFLEGSGEGRWVRHKNGDVKDNRVENLEWSDEKEERRGRKSVERVVRAVTRGGEMVGIWRSVKDASRESGVSEYAIRSALRGERKSAGGLLWF